MLRTRLPQPRTQESEWPMPAPAPGKPIEILLVEDSPDDASLTIEALRDGKVRNQVHQVWDGVQALALLRREGSNTSSPRPDLVLLDLLLPKKNGREVLAEIKQHPDL